MSATISQRLGHAGIASLLLCLIPATARAQGFDLDCQMMEGDGTVRFAAPVLHMQIDLETSRWCSATCDGRSFAQAGQIVPADGDLVMLRDVSSIGDITEISIDRATGNMVWRFEPGTEFQLLRRYRCSGAPFGGLTPYLASRPVPRSQMRMTEADFLSDERGRKVSGYVGIAMPVSSEGRAGVCQVALPSGIAALDQYACALATQRMTQFTPARDRSGVAVDGVYEVALRWVAGR